MQTVAELPARFCAVVRGSGHGGMWPRHGRDAMIRSGRNPEAGSWTRAGRHCSACRSAKAANIVLAPARKTSRTCRECGAVDRRSRRTRADLVCTACRHAVHADINAAKSILALGIESVGQGCEAAGTGAFARQEALVLAASSDRRNHAGVTA